MPDKNVDVKATINQQPQLIKERLAKEFSYQSVQIFIRMHACMHDATTMLPYSNLWTFYIFALLSGFVSTSQEVNLKWVLRT